MLFEYRYRAASGAIATGRIDGENRQETLMRLRRRGITPFSFKDIQVNTKPKITRRTWLLLLCILTTMVTIVASSLLLSHLTPNARDGENVLTDEATTQEWSHTNVAELISGEEILGSVIKETVIIHTDKGAASGVVISDEGALYLYTCEHVIHGAMTVTALTPDGKKLSLGEFEVASNRDMVRFDISDSGMKGLSVYNGNLKMDTTVYAFGNTHGDDVITQSKGKVLGVGPQTIEIDCEVMQGNSGGPVTTEGGKVVALVARGNVDTSIHSKGTRYEKVRRFADRIDGTEWIQMNFEKYLEQTLSFNDISVCLDELELLIKDYVQNPNSKIFRPNGAQALYKYLYNLGRYIDEEYRLHNQAVDLNAKYLGLADDYANFVEKERAKPRTFSNNETFQLLQNLRTEMHYFITRQTEVQKEKHQIDERGLYSLPDSTIRILESHLNACDVRIPSFKEKVALLRRRMKVEWRERLTLIRKALSDEEVAIQNTYLKRLSEAEDMYRDFMSKYREITR